MIRIRLHRRLPWVVASSVAPAVYLAIYSSAGLLINLAANIMPYFYFTVAVLLMAAALTGFLFRGRFEYPLKGIFFTSAASSCIIILVGSISMAARYIGNLMSSDLALFLAYIIALSAVEGTILAVLIVLGAAVRQRFK